MLMDSKYLSTDIASELDASLNHQLMEEFKRF